MALQLCKAAGFVLGSAGTYDPYSTSDGTDPVSISVTLTNAGGTLDSSVVDAKLLATTYKYTSISITTESETTGIDWKLSIDGGSTYLDTVTPSDLNALVSDAASDIKLKAVVNNNNTVTTGIYTACKVKITATENPE